MYLLMLMQKFVDVDQKYIVVQGAGGCILLKKYCKVVKAGSRT